MKANSTYCIIPPQLDIESEQYIINYIKRFQTRSIVLIFLEECSLKQQLDPLYKSVLSSQQELGAYFLKFNKLSVVFFSSVSIDNIFSKLKQALVSLNVTKVILPNYNIIHTTDQDCFNKIIVPSKEKASQCQVANYIIDSAEVLDTLHFDGISNFSEFKVLFARPRQYSKLCLFATFDPNSIIHHHVLYYLQQIKENGFDIVLVSTSDKVIINDQVKSLCRMIIRRPNVGIDFGSWRVGMENCNINDYDAILLANDSVYGPFHSLEYIFNKFDGVANNFCALIESYERRYHCQSYFLYFKRPLFLKEYFTNFWKQSISLNKEEVIDNHEIGITQILTAHNERPFVFLSYIDLVSNLISNNSNQRALFFINRKIPFNPSSQLTWDTILQKPFLLPFIKRDVARDMFKTSFPDLKWLNPNISDQLPHLHMTDHLQRSIQLFQIYYDTNQLTSIKDATPYDNSLDTTGQCEYGVFMREFNSIQQSSSRYVGFLSWKFEEKTNHSPKSFKSFIQSNPGYDFYAMQPFPFYYFPQGVWVQGERFHPGLIATTLHALESLNLDLNIIHGHLIKSKLVTCNYWIATKEFWSEYQKYTFPIANFLIEEAKKDPALHQKLFVRTTNNQDTWGALFPYIMERLVVSFLMSRSNFKTKIWHTAEKVIL